jgi:hypothetical protein
MSPVVLASSSLFRSPYPQSSGSTFVKVFTPKHSRLHLLEWEPLRDEIDLLRFEGLLYLRASGGDILTILSCLSLRDGPSPFIREPTRYIFYIRARPSLLCSKFQGRHSSNYRWSLFLTEYDGETVLVKFCERYCEAALRILATAGLALALNVSSTT